MKIFQVLTSAAFGIGIISAKTGFSGKETIDEIVDRGHTLNDMNLTNLGEETVRICTNSYPYYAIIHNSGKTLEYDAIKKIVYLADMNNNDSVTDNGINEKQVFQIIKIGDQQKQNNEIVYLILTPGGQPIAKNFYNSNLMLSALQYTEGSPIIHWSFDNKNRIRNGRDCLDLVESELKVRSCEDSSSFWTLRKVNRTNKSDQSCLLFENNGLFLSERKSEAFKISRISDYLEFKSKNLTLSEKIPIKPKSLLNISIRIGTDAGKLWKVNRHGQIINKKTGKCLSHSGCLSHSVYQVKLEDCTIFGISDQSWKFESENK